MHLADAFIQSDLQCIQAIDFFVSMCTWYGVAYIMWASWLSPQSWHKHLHAAEVIK